ncbi:MAG: hypothetical protein IKA08_02820 [Alphaproteobacteria bacterium]|nr:hypothetical protein [Alphaproteobacteria bacterium]
MPGYSHEKTPHEGPYFDFATMENGYDGAVKQAKQWAVLFVKNRNTPLQYLLEFTNWPKV